MTIRRRCVRSVAVGVDDLDRDVIGPGLAGHHVGDIYCAAFEFAGGGVDKAVAHSR